MKHHFRITALVLALAAGASGAFANGNHAGGHDDGSIGEPGSKPTRTVNVEMTDSMRFTPASISVNKGETIRFLVKNSGQIKHEMVLGTPESLKEHYQMMMRMPGMEHADADQVTVAPGATGEIVWRFTKAGNVDFACLQPGHYDAGMKGVVSVR